MECSLFICFKGVKVVYIFVSMVFQLRKYLYVNYQERSNYVLHPILYDINMKLMSVHKTLMFSTKD